MRQLTQEEKAILANKVEAEHITKLLKRLNLTDKEKRARRARATMLKKLNKEKK